jgi:hypothetical protein
VRPEAGPGPWAGLCCSFQRNPAIKHWIRDVVRFEQTVPDSEVRDFFVRLDNGAAGFNLFTR